MEKLPHGKRIRHKRDQGKGTVVYRHESKRPRLYTVRWDDGRFTTESASNIYPITRPATA